MADIVADLLHYAGTGYLSGALLGGTTAFVDCLRYGDRSDGLKLRAIQMVNMVSHRGYKAGAWFAALGLLYASVDNALEQPGSLAATAAAAGGSGIALRPSFRNPVIACAAGGLLSATIFKR